MFSKIVTVFTNNIMVFALGAVYTVITTRVLGPGQRGVLVVAVLVATWLATLSQLGLPQSLIYNLSRNDRPGDAVASATAVCIRYLVAAAIIIVFVYFVLDHTPVLRGMPARLVLNSVLLCSALLLESMVVNVLAGLQDFRWRSIVTTVRPFLTAVALVILALRRTVMTPLEVVQLMAAFGFIGFLIGVCYIGRKYVPKRDMRLPEAWRSDYVSYGLKFYLATVCQALNYRLDTLIINAQLGSKDVGLYSAAVGAVELLLFVPISVAFVFYPKIASVQDDLRNQLTLLTLGLSLYVVVCGGIVLALTLPFLLPWVFGQAFTASVPAAELLIPGMLALTVVRILSYASAGVGRPEYATYTMLIGVLGTVPLDILLIPHFGIIGAAAASTIAYSLAAIGVLTLYMRLRAISVIGGLDGVLIGPVRWLWSAWQVRQAATRSVPS